jgi:hypothetical protein
VKCGAKVDFILMHWSIKSSATKRANRLAVSARSKLNYFVTISILLDFGQEKLLYQLTAKFIF